MPAQTSSDQKLNNDQLAVLRYALGNGILDLDRVHEMCMVYPELMKEWDFEKNSINPNTLIDGGFLKVFVAYDKDNNRIYADEAKNKECFCPACKEKVTPKVGSIKRPHFAHKRDSECAYGIDKDNKGPWHIHMQELFPRETWEEPFYDSDGKIRHIADVYLEESKTVIEFQHSPISVEDFKSRTFFHTSEGRRIIWVFDVSKKDCPLGHLTELFSHKDLCHYVYYWKQAHTDVLSAVFGQSGYDQFSDVSICLHLGSEGDVVHRIIVHDEGYKRILLSIHRFNLEEFNSDEYFDEESRWTNPSRWAAKMKEKQRIENADKTVHSVRKVTRKSNRL